MKQLLILFLLSCFTGVHAQEARPFDVKLYNEEFQFFIKINLYDKNIPVDGEDGILGELPGYFWTKRDTRKWYVLDSELKDEKTALLTFVNDFGSEDFTAILTYDDDGCYTLERQEGSKLKIVVNKKYVKIPKSVRLIRTI